MRKNIPGIILAAAAMLATPAMACTDWRARLELDAIISDEIRSELEAAKANGEEPSPYLLKEDFNKQAVIIDRKAALADKCQENARPQ